MQNGRVFLWRKTSNPYNVLIAEILLQKTDAQKIKAIYPKFIEICPSITHLHEIDETKLLDIFSKIGLYYKIQRLKKIAEIVIDEYKGKIPNNKNDLISLPGIGEYISNAILCFAYNNKYPIVDTNIVRLYKRVFNLTSKKKRPHTDKKIWKFAYDIMPDRNYINFNYGLLDFSNIVCRYDKPRCETCIMNVFCYFAQTNLVGG